MNLPIFINANANRQFFFFNLKKNACSERVTIEIVLNNKRNNHDHLSVDSFRRRSKSECEFIKIWIINSEHVNCIAYIIVDNKTKQA